jgi:diaminopimelate epimerase
MVIDAIKAHGSENDFFLIDNTSNRFNDEMKCTLAKILSQRSNILNGADGVIFMENGSNTPYKMRIFNADGNEALMCGNGLRIAGRWALAQKNCKVDSIENVTDLPYTITLDENFADGVNAVKIEFPPADLQAQFLLSNHTRPILSIQLPEIDSVNNYSAVAMPNPHIVSIIPTIDINKLKVVGEKANDKDCPYFVDGVNVSWVKIINNNTIFVNTYERGVGLTNSCGTAMIASTVTGILQGKLSYNTDITVYNLGGFIKVNVNDKLCAVMTGNATYNIFYQLNINEITNQIEVLQSVYTKEQENYNRLKSLVPAI